MQTRVMLLQRQILEAGKQVTLYGVMEKVVVRRSFKGHVPLTEAHVADQTGVVRAVWFNQAYIGKMYPDGTKVKVSGTVQQDKKGFFLSNPSIERAPEVIPDAGDSLFHQNVAPEFLIPVYRETKGVTSNYLYRLSRKPLQGARLMIFQIQYLRIFYKSFTCRTQRCTALYPFSKRRKAHHRCPQAIRV
jgi:RecG-like helicase